MSNWKTKAGILCAMSLMFSSASLFAATTRAGTLDTSFNPGGPKAGLQIVSMSPFLNIAEGIALQRQQTTKKDSYQIIVGGDAVQQGNPYEPPPGTPDTIDGFVDERGWSLVRLNQDGSVDYSFGPNGNGKVYLETGGVASVSALVNAVLVDSSDRIVYIGQTETASSALYVGPCAGFIGNAVPSGCSANPFAPPTCDFVIATDPNNPPHNPLGQTQLTVGRFTPDGALDPSFGVAGLFKLPLVFGPNTEGDVANAGAFDLQQNILVAGYSTPDLKGCLYGFPLLVSITPSGILNTSFNHTGIIVEGTVNTTVPPYNDLSSFTDYTVTPAQNLGFAQYENLTVYKSGPLKGYVVAVGDGDVNDQQWPFSARIIAARYTPNGALDTSFGVNGYLVISAQNFTLQKQLLCRSVVIDKAGNIYLGGDIADDGSGPPGATITSTLVAPNVLLSRPTANFLLIKLNPNGIPVDYGPSLPCNASGCNTEVFQNCNTCVLNWFNGTHTVSFRAITTDFKGWDDAIFALNIDNSRGLITASGQASEDSALQSMRTGIARYHLSDGSLDRSFGTGGLAMINGERNRRTLVRASTVDPCGKLLLAGQSGYSDEEVTTVNYADSTIKDFAVFRVNP